MAQKIASNQQTPIARQPTVEAEMAPGPAIEVEMAQQPATQSETADLPFALHLSGIFPPLLLSSIVRKGDRAEVEAVQPGLPEQSRLKLSIYPHRVPYLAREMFDVDADIKDMLLHMRLENGAIAQVLRLDGARHESLGKCFGTRVATAIRSSGKFAAEVRQGEVVTQCVSLELRRESGFACSFSLVIDPELLSTLVAEIWPH